MIDRLERAPGSTRWLAVTAVLLMGIGAWALARQPAAAATHTVQATNFAFTPMNLTVTVGDSVTWVNGDTESHAVEGGSLSSPEIRAGESFSRTFDAPESLTYFCRFHTYMTGTITVTAAGPPATTAPPPAPPPTAAPTTAPPTTTPPTTAPPGTPTTAAPSPVATTAPPPTAPLPPPTTAPPTSGPAFQAVPDDPAARQRPGLEGSSGDSFVRSAPTTTAPPPPAPTGPAPGFQEVPDDLSAHHPPGELGAQVTAPPAGPAPPAATAAPGPTGPAPGFQEVPDDPSAHHPPGTPGAQAAPPTTPPPTTAAPPPSTGDPPPASPPAPTSTAPLTAAPVPTDAGTPLGDGTVLAPYDEVDGVKEFHLTMTETTIETSPGVVKQAYAFNGVVPGPVLRVDEGDRVRIVVDNQLPFPTSTHWHGMILPNDQDGVGGITQPHIEPGGQYVYEWTAVATGTHWYHAHSSGRHIGKGLYGPLEVVPRSGDIEADRDYRLMLGDTDLGFTLNGRSFPSTPTLEANVGETVRLRLINTGDQVHAMHLHGVPFEVAAQDGIVRRQPESMDTLTIAPGQTYDLLFAQEYPGQWLVHCHMFIHSHMSTDEHPPGESGMNGMVAVLAVGPAGEGGADGAGGAAGSAAELDVFGQSDLGTVDLGALDLLGAVGVLVSIAYARRRLGSVPSPQAALKGPH